MGIYDKNLKQRFGSQRPFQVPDGYFDNLASEIMNKIPVEEVRTLKKNVVRHRRMIILRVSSVAAACLLGAIFTISTIVNNGDNHDIGFKNPTANIEHLSETTNNSIYFDEAADYSMIDNEDIYAYAAEN
jgi:hypothetical protein